MIGKCFGNLAVIGVDNTKIKPDYYKCLCICGSTYVFFGPRLRRLDVIKCRDCSIKDRCRIITPKIVPQFYWKRTEDGAKKEILNLTSILIMGKNYSINKIVSAHLAGKTLCFHRQNLRIAIFLRLHWTE